VNARWLRAFAVAAVAAVAGVFTGNAIILLHSLFQFDQECFRLSVTEKSIFVFCVTPNIWFMR
jgi:hypothetical protein